MTKQDFLDELQRTLTNKISAAAVAEHVNYYREYIEVEVRKGKSEEAVVEELGSPRLIAKSILTTAATEQGQSSYGNAQSKVEGDGDGQSGWRSKLPVILLLIGVLVILLIAGVFLTSVIRILFPILLPIILVILLVKWWNSRR
ncbi:MAG: DUF1700 domain-containing protein [Lachnospiraceae bacterium]|nr:DUF1700 domain-containing protein [Lachnospiraceae bacterium]